MLQSVGFSTRGQIHGTQAGDTVGGKPSSSLRFRGDGRNIPHSFLPTAVLRPPRSMSAFLGSLSAPQRPYRGSILPPAPQPVAGRPCFCPFLWRNRSVRAWKGARSFLTFIFVSFVYMTLFLHDLFSNENSKITSRSFQIGRQNK